jgi:hypothetical protein
VISINTINYHGKIKCIFKYHGKTKARGSSDGDDDLVLVEKAECLSSGRWCDEASSLELADSSISLVMCSELWLNANLYG